MKTAVIILGHGSRQPGAGDPLRLVVEAVRAKSGYDMVEHAFLRNASPGIEETIDRCAEQGAGSIIIVPFFVQPGSHVVSDIPGLVAAAQQRHPGVRMRAAAHVGSHALMADIVLDLAKNAEGNS